MEKRQTTQIPRKKRVTTLISDNVDFRGMNIIQGLERHFKIIRGPYILKTKQF